MDTSKLQLGSVISQKDKPIAFWSRKCNPTSVERELFKIIETLKECRNILLGQQIKVFTDHENLNSIIVSRKSYEMMTYSRRI